VSGFTWREGQLTCDGTPVAEIAGATGTPVYIYSAALVREALAALGAAFEGYPHAIHYALKANSTLAVLRLLRDLGTGADANSGGEIEAALRAGFDPARLHEIHGSIHHLQCLSPCGGAIWDAAGEDAEVDESTMRARRIPRCPTCGGVARPNVLMFGDLGWIPDRSAAQRARFAGFLEDVRDARLAVVELGAGTAIASIRMLSESLGARGAGVVRINPREEGIGPPHVGIAAGALEGLRAIDAALSAG